MDDAASSIAASPTPTETTLRRRSNIVFQFGRFIALNVRMLTMITKGSH